jgi:hypothetical protein
MSGGWDVRLVRARGDGARAWRDALERLPRRDVYWLPEYAAAYEDIGEGEAAAFIGRRAEDLVIHPVIVRDVTALDWARPLRAEAGAKRWLDAVTPYGYGGPLTSETDPARAAALAASFEEARGALCREEGIVSEFIRFHPLLGNHAGLEGRASLVRRGETIWLRLGSEEALLAAMQPAARNKVRRARRDGVQTAFESGPEAVRTLFDVYTQTMRALDAPPGYFFPESYFAALAALPDGAARILVARHEGRAAWAGLFLRAGDLLHYHLSGTAGGPRVTGVNNLALLAAALHGHSEGAQRFHLGGGFGSREDSLFQFKASVGDRRAEFWTGSVVHDPRRYEMLCGLRGLKMEKGDGGGAPGSGAGDYFPAYRAP